MVDHVKQRNFPLFSDQIQFKISLLEVLLSPEITVAFMFAILLKLDKLIFALKKMKLILNQVLKKSPLTFKSDHLVSEMVLKRPPGLEEKTWAFIYPGTKLFV